MVKILNILILITMGLLSSQVNAKTLALKSNESKLLTNNSLWTLNATCTIQGTNQTHSKVKISVLKNNGSINGRNLTSGQATFVTVKNNSVISVSAESGTQINLVNLGEEELQAVCYT